MFPKPGKRARDKCVDWNSRDWSRKRATGKSCSRPLISVDAEARKARGRGLSDQKRRPHQPYDQTGPLLNRRRQSRGTRRTSIRTEASSGVQAEPMTHSQ